MHCVIIVVIAIFVRTFLLFCTVIPRLHDEANVKQTCSIYTCTTCAL